MLRLLLLFLSAHDLSLRLPSYSLRFRSFLLRLRSIFHNRYRCNIHCFRLPYRLPLSLLSCSVYDLSLRLPSYSLQSHSFLLRLRNTFRIRYRCNIRCFRLPYRLPLSLLFSSVYAYEPLQVLQSLFAVLLLLPALLHLLIPL